jgi:hypothetical protein
MKTKGRQDPSAYGDRVVPISPGLGNKRRWAPAEPPPETAGETLWAVLAGVLLVMIPGIIGLALGKSLLFSSLGPTAFMQAVDPHRASSRSFAIVLGHLIGMGAGFAAVFLLGATSEPPMSVTYEPAPLRIWASVIGIALTLLFQLLLRAKHAPGAATTLLITLGACPVSWTAFRTLVFGVSIIAIAGQIYRKIRSI